MNHFTINGKRYRAEIAANAVGGDPFYFTIGVLNPYGWREQRRFFATRPAARRALAREIERLAIGPDGKRANWSVVYPLREFEAWTERVAGAAGDLADSMRAAGDAFERYGDAARRIIERAAGKMDLPVGEFARRVRGEVQP